MSHIFYYFNGREVPKSTYYDKRKKFPEACNRKIDSHPLQYNCYDEERYGFMDDVSSDEEQFECMEDSSSNEEQFESMEDSSDDNRYDGYDDIDKECNEYEEEYDEYDQTTLCNQMMMSNEDYDTGESSTHQYAETEDMIDEEVIGEEDSDEEEYELQNEKEFRKLFRSYQHKQPHFQLDYDGTIEGVTLNELVLFLLKLKRKHRIQDSVLDDMSTLFNRMNNKFPKSFKTIKTKISNAQYKEEFYHCRNCGNNCSKHNECSYCQNEMEEKDKLLYQPLSSIIKFKMKYDTKFSKLITETKIDKTVDWWGSESKRIVELFEKKKDTRTIYISIYSDGLSLSKSSERNAYPQLTTILNLPKEQRFVFNSDFLYIMIWIVIEIILLLTCDCVLIDL